MTSGGPVKEPATYYSVSKSSLEENGVPASQTEELKPVNAPLTTKQWAIAFFCLVIFVALTTASGQFSNIAFADPTLKFNAPFLFVLFKTVFRAMGFPIYLFVNTIIKLASGRKINIRRTWRRCQTSCGENGLTVRFLLVKVLPATAFNLLVQISYTFGIGYLTTSLASSLNPPAVATSYLFGWWFLRQRVLSVKIFSVLVMFAGVTVIVYHELSAIGGVSTRVLIGILAMISNDLCLSSYQIFFKKAFPKGDLGQVSFAVSTMYVLMLLIYWPVPIILYMTGYEVYDIRTLPYGFLVGAWSCTAVSAMVYGYGIVVSSGFFMGLSDLVILGANSVIDVAFRGISIPVYQIIGTVVIAVAFIFMVMPDHLLSIDIRRLYCKLTGKQPSSELVNSRSVSSISTAISNSSPEKFEVEDGKATGYNLGIDQCNDDFLENSEVLKKSERTLSMIS